MPFILSESHRAESQRDGYLIIKQLFDIEEIDLLGNIARAYRDLGGEPANRRDGDGGVIRLSVRNALERDIYSAFDENLHQGRKAADRTS